jgi:penicillin-binding protein 2
MTDASDSAAIARLQKDTASPFLNRAVNGVYTPGSIVKPFVALAALHEGVITPEKQILSTGSISIENPYDPDKPTVFNDWRPQGWVDVRHALAVSSNVYFFEVGGGYENQKGIGIEKINSYLRLFGFGEEVPGDYFAGETGVVPDPLWKAAHFDGEEWRIGDTYNTSIGQYGFQVTAMQAVRAVAAVGNGGTLLSPTIVYRGNEFRAGTTTPLPFSASEMKVVREGMRLGVTEGIAKALNIPGLTVAAKTGTAELGSRKEYVNSWVTGFFPFEKPRYAFAVIMERGPRTNVYGAVLVMKELLEWIQTDAPEYFSSPKQQKSTDGSVGPQD